MDTPFMGMIVPFGFTYPPKDWAFCQGQMLAVNSYTTLFSLIGNKFGGDGVTTFALPDLRGRAAMGVGTGPGLTPCNLAQVQGAETTTLNVGNLPPHTHIVVPDGQPTIRVSSQPGGSPEPSETNNMLGALNDPNLSNTNNFYNEEEPDIPLNTGNQGAALQNAGNGAAFSILQPSLVINYSISLSGLYPSRG